MTSPLSFWGFTTSVMEGIFGADSLMNAILRFEAALAGALADVGIAPEDEANAVVAICQDPVDDAEEILRSTWTDGTPLIAVIRILRLRLETDDQRRWVHYGTTTQDVLDTAHMLLFREALDHLDQQLTRICRTMRSLVMEYRDVPHIARTFLRDAQPTTFGYRVAGWLEALLTHLETLRSARADLTVQLGGAAGNLAVYEHQGAAMVEALAAHLDMQVPDLPWHTNRSRIWSLTSSVVDPVTTLAKVATDVALLGQDAVGEVTVRSGGSSAMAGKENPIDAIRALAAADVCQGAASMIDRARPHELDRALGSWHAEWVALPLVFSSASAVMEAATLLLESLEVEADVMASRAEEAPQIDPGLIDGVLERCSRLA